METVHKSQEQRVRGPPDCEEELGAGVPILLDIQMLLGLGELGPKAEEWWWWDGKLQLSSLALCGSLRQRGSVDKNFLHVPHDSSQ